MCGGMFIKFSWFHCLDRNENGLCASFGKKDKFKGTTATIPAAAKYSKKNRRNSIENPHDKLIHRRFSNVIWKAEAQAPTPPKIIYSGEKLCTHTIQERKNISFIIYSIYICVGACGIEYECSHTRRSWQIKNKLFWTSMCSFEWMNSLSRIE